MVQFKVQGGFKFGLKENYPKNPRLDPDQWKGEWTCIIAGAFWSSKTRYLVGAFNAAQLKNVIRPIGSLLAPLLGW